MKYDLIAFDWNGTIYDDLQKSVFSINKVLAHYGKKQLPVGQYRRHFTYPIIDYYKTIGLDDVFEEASNIFFEEFEKHTYHIFCAGFIPFFEKIKGKTRTCILTAGHTNRIKRQKFLSKFPYACVEVYGLDDDNAVSKIEVAKRMKSDFSAKNILVIGDTLHDLECANAIGADCLLVSTGHNSRERLKSRSNNVHSRLSAKLAESIIKS